MTKEEYIQDFDRVYWPRIKDICPLDTKEILLAKGFFDAPASTKYHGNYSGGLCEHSYNVTDSLVFMTEALDLYWERPESPYIVGLFHDLCKCDQYVENQPGHFVYREDVLFKGHGEKSVMVAAQICRLTEEEIACIRYRMGSFTEKEQWGEYTGAIHQYPNVLYTHTADMIASHIMEVS